MTMASADKQSTYDGLVCLEVILLNRTYILPWNQFLYAEGGNDEIRLVFTTHDVVIRGTQLGQLLSEISSQRINRLREPSRADVFQSGSPRHITTISIEKSE
jgi:hypothetical protein